MCSYSRKKAVVIVNMKKYEAIETSNVGFDYYKREMKIKHRMMDRKHHPGNWSNE